MKYMTFALAISLMSGGAFAQSNVSNMGDNLDENIIKSEHETREKVEKPTNLSDAKDRNYVPGPFEERQAEEESVLSDDQKASGSTQQGTGSSTNEGTGSSPQPDDGGY